MHVGEGEKPGPDAAALKRALGERDTAGAQLDDTKGEASDVELLIKPESR